MRNYKREIFREIHEFGLGMVISIGRKWAGGRLNHRLEESIVLLSMNPQNPYFMEGNKVFIVMN